MFDADTQERIRRTATAVQKADTVESDLRNIARLHEALLAVSDQLSLGHQLYLRDFGVKCSKLDALWCALKSHLGDVADPPRLAELAEVEAKLELAAVAASALLLCGNLITSGDWESENS